MTVDQPARTRGRRRRYVVNPYRATKVPSPYALHLMNRLGCGWSPDTFAQMQAVGGPTAWFYQQLDPASVPEDVYPLRIEPVGRYAIQIAWSDGHESGIYPFRRLRELG